MDTYNVLRRLVEQVEKVVDVQQDLIKTVRLQQEQIAALQDQMDGAGPTTNEVAREIGWEGPADTLEAQYGDQVVSYSD